MGRRAGLSADDTRRLLLDAAADVFAVKGYDGAGVAEIARAAGLTSGAIYAHYASKAELFAATLQAHGRSHRSELIGSGGEQHITDFARAVGAGIDRREQRQAALFVEAIVAAKRNPDVADLVVSALVDGESQFADAAKAGIHAGVVAADVNAQALARFLTMVGLGSALTATLALPSPDHDDWERLIDRFTNAVRATPGDEPR